jgi:NAD(P)-dependent dehydrogenase (short-subunit alcohol dehydrogenase family)
VEISLRDANPCTQELAGKRALVTDCDEFMGGTIAELFERHGASVFADRRDLTQPGATEQVIAEAGLVDILIASLAVTPRVMPTFEINEAEIRFYMERLVYPLHRLVKGIVPAMVERGSGKVIVVGSAAGVRGKLNSATYAAARGAQLAYVRSLALECAPSVQVNATAQAYVANPVYFDDNYIASEAFGRDMARLPAGRLACPEECAELVLFMASEKGNFFYVNVIPFAGGSA